MSLVMSEKFDRWYKSRFGDQKVEKRHRAMCFDLWNEIFNCVSQINPDPLTIEVIRVGKRLNINPKGDTTLDVQLATIKEIESMLDVAARTFARHNVL